MPASRAERIVFGLGLAVTAGLLVLLLTAWMGYREELPKASAPPRLAPASTAVQPTPRDEVSVRPQRMRRPAPAPPPPPQPQPAPAAPPRLTLRAARGDCWLEVRLASETGRILFAGTLARGTTRTFSSKRLWVRLGAGEMVDARLDGKRARLPAGTANVVVTRRGVRPLPPSS